MEYIIIDPANTNSQQKGFEEAASFDPAGFLLFARNDTLGDSWIPGLRQE